MNNTLSKEWLDQHTCYHTSKLLTNQPLPFPQDIGEGYKFKCCNEEYITEGRRTDGKRTVDFDITSYIGFSAGAMHYYCRGKIRISNRKEGTDCICAGSIERAVPADKKHCEFDICRPLTEEDIKKDPNRWKYHHEGASCTAFESKQEIMDILNKLKDYFAGWKMTINDLS